MVQFFGELGEGLTRYVRYTAWLHTAPRPEKPPKGFRPVARLEKLRADRKDPDYLPEMPDVEGGEYILTALWDAGPTLPGGMGPAPLTHGEIRAWQENTGAELQPWQARLLRRLSAEYVNECARAERPDCPSPLATALSQEDREAVSRKVQNAMRQLITTHPRNKA